MNQASIRLRMASRFRIEARNIAEGAGKMTYDEQQFEIEKSVMILGVAFAVSLISLIVWVA